MTRGELKNTVVSPSVAFLVAKTGARHSVTEELMQPVAKSVTSISERTPAIGEIPFIR